MVPIIHYLTFKMSLIPYWSRHSYRFLERKGNMDGWNLSMSCLQILSTFLLDFILEFVCCVRRNKQSGCTLKCMFIKWVIEICMLCCSWHDLFYQIKDVQNLVITARNYWKWIARWRPLLDGKHVDGYSVCFNRPLGWIKCGR